MFTREGTGASTKALTTVFDTNQLGRMVGVVLIIIVDTNFTYHALLSNKNIVMISYFIQTILLKSTGLPWIKAIAWYLTNYLCIGWITIGCSLISTGIDGRHLINGTERLTNLSEEIGNLASLVRLNLNGAIHIQSLPSSIGGSQVLQEVDLGGTTWHTTLPEDIRNLANLVGLSLFNSQGIRSLPPSIGQLESLKVLVLRGTENLTSLPQEIVNLPIGSPTHDNGISLYPPKCTSCLSGT